MSHITPVFKTPIPKLPIPTPSLSHPTPSSISSLPYEILSLIFSLLDLDSTPVFSRLSSLFFKISIDPHARCQWFLSRYKKQLALFYAFKHHRNILGSDIGPLLISRGCNVQRFLIQLVDREYHKVPERGISPVSNLQYYFFMTAGFKAFGANVDFRDDDIQRIEKYLYSSPSSLPDSRNNVKLLLDKYLFVPVRGLGSPVDEILVSKLDISLIPSLVKNGLEIDQVNDMILERLLWRSDINDRILSSYLNVGFKLTDAAIKKGIHFGKANILDLFKSYISPHKLQVLAQDTIVDLFGPSIRGWTFSPEATDFIVSTFEIPEEIFRHAILRTPASEIDLFPATRCYMKANPCPVWLWILRKYGPTHEFSNASFDDAISRAAADRDLHALHDIFLEAGTKFRPRHVKILACRVLHRDMTANALHLLKCLQNQVSELCHDYFKRSLKADSTITNSFFLFGGNKESVKLYDHMPQVTLPKNFSLKICEDWIIAIRNEITESIEWSTRMRTTQLEGGPRGGAYRITKAPDDALKFLECAKEIVAELKNARKLFQIKDEIIGKTLVRSASSQLSVPRPRNPDLKFTSDVAFGRSGSAPLSSPFSERVSNEDHLVPDEGEIDVMHASPLNYSSSSSVPMNRNTADDDTFTITPGNYHYEPDFEEDNERSESIADTEISMQTRRFRFFGGSSFQRAVRFLSRDGN